MKNIAGIILFCFLIGGQFCCSNHNSRKKGYHKSLINTIVSEPFYKRYCVTNALNQEDIYFIRNVYDSIYKHKPFLKIDSNRYKYEILNSYDNFLHDSLGYRLCDKVPSIFLSSPIYLKDSSEAIIYTERRVGDSKIKELLIYKYDKEWKKFGGYYMEDINIKGQFPSFETE